MSIMDKRLASIPDVLQSSNGENISTAEQWLATRRDEIVELFREHVYGREPVQRPELVHYSVVDTENMMDGSALRRKVDIIFEGPGGKGEIRLVLFIPKTNNNKPVPAFLLLNIHEESFTDPDRNNQSSIWPAEMIVARGYAAAVIQAADIDPDFDDGFKNGVHGIFDCPDQTRASDAWGTIAAWAWGASRVMDYLATDPLIDDQRVGVVGHSRGGKAALWAGALDPRFAMVVSNESGCTGAAISRGKKGETIRQINDTFPYWFNENYKQYNGKEHQLPVDQHMLLSLIAPRLLYVSSATEDEWADPESEFLSTVLANKVYRLFGLSGTNTDVFPEPDHPIHGDAIGYHLRTGKHELVEYDWKCFIDFADVRYAQTK